MTPAQLVEVGEGGDETLVVRVVAAVLGLQLSSQLRLAVAHCPAKTDVLAHLETRMIISRLPKKVDEDEDGIHRELRRKGGGEKERGGGGKMQRWRRSRQLNNCHQ